eukprot:CAMPEP_0178924420 /NCGR_PEP_ID=MMETSP0786-20121207/17320_1 /TAXON_ID=186022 /ORGANISM="Thalassionema frauenfeldii, Strain CCMP 1798" /LENGTH=183 /DNA_ID=CAMNT_0020599135 /DNA_START=90 /DNA_END=639 /DNA_ORIENTATION=-
MDSYVCLRPYGHVRVELYGLRKTVLLEAHESSLRALALTEDGTHLATASTKGTIIRVFRVSNQSCIAEFRRGVERVTMNAYDGVGIIRIWHVVPKKVPLMYFESLRHRRRMYKKHASSSSSSSSSSSWYDKVRKKVGRGTHDLKASVAQIRGVARPIACAFVPDLPNTLAVVGWDLEGNGVLL